MSGHPAFRGSVLAVARQLRLAAAPNQGGIPRVRSIWALSLVLFLAACGGGGGGGSLPPTTRSVEPPTRPRDIRAEISAVYAEADTILASDVSITFEGNQVSEHRGVSPANFTDRWVWYNRPINVRGYGGCMEFNAFDVGAAQIGSGPFAGTQGAAATSIGNNTGSRPTGSATWHGAMSEERTSTTGPRRFGAMRLSSTRREAWSTSRSRAFATSTRGSSFTTWTGQEIYGRVSNPPTPER